MPTYGGYETVKELHRGALGAVWSARRAGTADEPVFAVRVCQPDVTILSQMRATETLNDFLARARAQQRAAQAAPLVETRWAQVYEVGELAPSESASAGAYMVTDLATRGTLESLVAARADIDARTLAAIAEGIVTGLVQIQSSAGGGRGHGALQPSNVLLLAGTPGQPLPKGGASRGKLPRVALTDPASVAARTPEAMAGDDLVALGGVLHQLVLHEPFRGQLPLAPDARWNRLGKSGDAWRQLTEKLLDRSTAPPALTDVLAEVRTIRRIRRSRAPWIVGAAALLLVAGGVGIYWVAERARQQQAAPLPETLWGPEASERWVALCDAYRTWYGSLLTRLEQRPPTASTQHRTRRSWYAALDKDLAELLSPHGLTVGKGSDPWSLAGVEAGADLSTLASSPTARARSDASVEKTRAALEAIGALQGDLREKWSGVARMQSLAGEWESRGWARQGEYVRRVADAVAPGEAASADVATSIDDLLRARGMVERVEMRWQALRKLADEVATADDPVLKKTPQSIEGIVLPPVDPATAGTSPGRDDVAALERDIDVATEIAQRLQQFLGQEWQGIDADSFRSSSRYAQLVDAEPGAETLEAWLFEVRGHARLDPALDPRGSWDAVALLQPITSATAELSRPPLSVELDRQTVDRIASVEASVAELAPTKMLWNRRNQEQVETGALRVRREIASLQAELEGRIAERRQELATTAEQLRTQLRARAAVSPDSPALNAAWNAGRDRLLERHTGIDVEALKLAARNLEGELNWASAAFGAARPGDDLDGRVRRPPGAKGPLFTSRIAKTIGELREQALAAALQEAGDPLGESFRAKIEAAARVHRERMDTVAAQVTALELAQLRMDAGDPLIDETGSAERLTRASQTARELSSRSPAITEALADLRSRLDTVGQVIQETSPDALIALIRNARPDRPETAMAAFRRLGAPEVGWPATIDDLSEGAGVRDAMLRVAASINDAARSEELAGSVRRALAARWTALASRTADAVAFEPVALAAPDFAVTTSTLPPTLRFNVLLTQVRRALARPGLQEDVARQLAAAFVSDVRAINGLPPAVTSRVAQVTGLIDGSEPEPPSIDPLTLGPGAAGWRGEADESGRLTFTSSNTRLEFVRLEVQRGGETVPVYFGVSEVSVGTLARIVSQARSQAELRQTLQPFDPGTATWSGPRSWTWNSSGAVTHAPLWLKLDANATAQRPAYAPALLRPGDFRLVRDEAGGEPSAEHPMQQLSPAAAALVARMAGCRLPATDEWRAARGQFAATAELAEWNLRDATFTAQKNHTRAMQSQVVNKASFPWPDANILLPDEPKVPVQDRATAYEFDDGTLWFTPATSDSRHPVHHLVGNVAEYVFDQPDRMDAARPTADGVQSVFQSAPTALGAIGGSALSPPELAPDTRIPVDLLFSTEGFADVGFRLAFTARGTRPPRETLASKILRVLSPDTYIFAGR